jgi:hypothetical protein
MDHNQRRDACSRPRPAPTLHIGGRRYRMVRDGRRLRGRGPRLLLAHLAGVPREPLTWRMTHGAAFFDNQIATLELDNRSATITFEKSVLDASKEPTLEKLYRRRLA